MAITNTTPITFRIGEDASLTSPALQTGSIIFDSTNGNGFIDTSDTQRIQIKDDTKLPLTGGTMKGNIDMNAYSIFSSRITKIGGYGAVQFYDTHTPGSSNIPVVVKGVSTPIEPTDVANKQYVDNITSSTVLQWVEW